MPGSVEERVKLEVAALLLIEQSGKQCRTVEPRPAEKIDRPVHAYQRERAQVADDTVVLNRLLGGCGTHGPLSVVSEARVQGHAAIDEERCAGDIVALVRREPHGCAGDILRLADTTVGDQSEKLL